MNRSTYWMIKYMNGSVFSKARYMNGVGFEILARTPVPNLPLSYPSPTPPPPHPRLQKAWMESKSPDDTWRLCWMIWICTFCEDIFFNCCCCCCFLTQRCFSSFFIGRKSQGDGYTIKGIFSDIEIFTLRNHAYSNISKISLPKTEYFQIKLIYVSYFCSKHRMRIFVRTASSRRF